MDDIKEQYIFSVKQQQNKVASHDLLYERLSCKIKEEL